MSNHMGAMEQVMHILSLRHPNTEKQLHPAVIGSAIYYVQKWTETLNAPPDKIGAKDNGNIAMAWEQTTPPVAIDISGSNQSAKILMQSADGQVTEKINQEGTDAKALETVVNLLIAINQMSAAPEEDDPRDEQPQTQAVVGG